MKAFLLRSLRLAVTLVVVAIAAGVGWNVWHDYMNTPWTRDGHVRADVIGITPDVSGPVGAVLVRDNQTVAKGDVLIEIDAARFQLALDLAKAALADKQAALQQAERNAGRYRKLGKGAAVSQQTIEEAQLAAVQAEAAYQEALSNRGVAELNLERAVVRAPSAGIVSNLSLNPGDYVTAGKAVMALVDTETLRVEGYFEESQLTRIAVGDPVEIDLMAGTAKLTGRVESIAAGIEDRERSDGSNLLANVTPTFSWVRLAQRIPVRVALDAVPEGIRLVAGLTATVTVRPKGDADGGSLPTVAAAE
jgi:multidrug resistance efflux pump